MLSSTGGEIRWRTRWGFGAKKQEGKGRRWGGKGSVWMGSALIMDRDAFAQHLCGLPPPSLAVHHVKVCPKHPVEQGALSATLPPDDAHDAKLAPRLPKPLPLDIISEFVAAERTKVQLEGPQESTRKPKERALEGLQPSGGHHHVPRILPHHQSAGRRSGMRVQQAMPPVLHLRRNDLHNTITIIGEVFSRHLEFWFKLINLVFKLTGQQSSHSQLLEWGRLPLLEEGREAGRCKRFREPLTQAA